MRILSDYELNLKIFINKLPIKKLPFVVATCGEDGASSNLETSLEETNIVRARLLGDGIVNKLLSILLRFYYAQKQLRKRLFK